MCPSELSAGFSGSVGGSQARSCPTPAQSAAVPWQQLSLLLTGLNLNQFLCSQNKGTLNEGKAMVPPV